MARKAQGLSITTIVTLALAVMALFFVVQFFIGGFREPAEATREVGTETAEGIGDINIRERIIGKGYGCDTKSGISGENCAGLTNEVCDSIGGCQWGGSSDGCSGTVLDCTELTISLCQKVDGCIVVTN